MHTQAHKHTCTHMHTCTHFTHPHKKSILLERSNENVANWQELTGRREANLARPTDAAVTLLLALPEGCSLVGYLATTPCERNPTHQADERQICNESKVNKLFARPELLQLPVNISSTRQDVLPYHSVPLPFPANVHPFPNFHPLSNFILWILILMNFFRDSPSSFSLTPFAIVASGFIVEQYGLWQRHSDACNRCSVTTLRCDGATSN